MDPEEFRNQLLENRLLYATSVDGLYQRSALFESIVLGLEGMIRDLGRVYSPEERYLPAVMPRADFERTDYLRSFPDLTGSVEVFTGDDTKHAELLRLYESAKDWTTELSPSEVTLCSAACHPLYGTISNSDVPSDGIMFHIHGTCFRHEPSLDPARQQIFRQTEFVLVGTADQARQHRDHWLAQGLRMMRGLGLQVDDEIANDPFFGRAGRILARSQRNDAAKFEITASVTDPRRTAICSTNYHGAHFGENFDIRQSDGSPAHTACIGFGLERIVLALLSQHGLDVKGWPRDVSQKFGAMEGSE